MGMALWLAPVDEAAAWVDADPGGAAMVVERLLAVTESFGTAGIRTVGMFADQLTRGDDP